MYRRRDSHSGSRMELENLSGDAKRKGTSGSPARLKVAMRRNRGGPPRSSDEAGVMLVERRGWVTDVGSGQPATGGTWSINGRRQLSNGGTSRMTRECQVRICERLGVKFPGPTRRRRNGLIRSVISCLLGCDFDNHHLIGRQARFTDRHPRFPRELSR